MRKYITLCQFSEDYSGKYLNIQEMKLQDFSLLTYTQYALLLFCPAY